jgi:hypothetical protein
MSDTDQSLSPFVPPNEVADYRQCGICSQLADREYACQKVAPDPDDTRLPEAAYRLQAVRDLVSEGGGRRELWQCRECTTCYLYRWEYEFLYGFGGSEDSQELTRLTAAETAEWLKRAAPSRGGPAAGRRADAAAKLSPRVPDPRPAPAVNEATPVIKESLSIDASESGFIDVHYVQLDEGLDMGGRLLLERQSVPLIIALLHASLNVGAFGGVECRCGDDSFRVYGSGSDQQPIINILNRRPDGAPRGGLTGLMLTTAAAEALFEQLCALG